MNTPGFTAEASLGKATESYALTAQASGAGGGVQPALSFQHVGNHTVITYCDTSVGCIQIWVPGGGRSHVLDAWPRRS
jgi:hypothetical protein